jgi:mannose/fructose/N-acetylgalactosamine-specific phosphotransferase system component IIC
VIADLLPDLLPAVLLGAVLGLDVVGFPQAMWSRPLVAATLAGAFAGDPERGLLLGVLLELVALGTLPFGASRYPEWGSASVVGGVLVAQGGTAATGQLTLALFAALLTAWLSGESMVWLRQLNGRRSVAAREALAAGVPGTVERLTLGGLAWDLLRGGAVTALGLLALAPVQALLLPRWGGGPVAERAVLAGVTAALGAATIWMLVRGTWVARGLAITGLAVGVAWLL